MLTRRKAVFLPNRDPTILIHMIGREDVVIRFSEVVILIFIPRQYLLRYSHHLGLASRQYAQFLSSYNLCRMIHRRLRDSYHQITLRHRLQYASGYKYLLVEIHLNIHIFHCHCRNKPQLNLMRTG